jgi:hypothetical protein
LRRTARRGRIVRVLSETLVSEMIEVVVTDYDGMDLAEAVI